MLDNIMDKLRSEIILIGPPFAGKSTVGKLLAVELSLPQISLDNLRWDYYREIGFDDSLAKEIRHKGGFLAVVAYWSLFNSYAIERILAHYHHCVFDLGVGPIVFENNILKTQIANALIPFINVVRLLPSPNLDTSINVLKERGKHLKGTNAQGFDWSTYFVKSDANRQLAKYEIYTEGKAPAETCHEIIALLQKQDIG
jgi:adenylate kinase family enzyme